MLQAYTVSFSPMALEDIRQAVEYYEDLQKGLEDRFRKELQSTLYSIQRNALFASIRYDDIRCAQLRKFPYAIHYHVDEKEKAVIIIAVYSNYQKPLWE
jgi:toxin ParE1/3/4